MSSTLEILSVVGSLGSLFVVTLAAIGFGIRLGKIEQQIKQYGVTQAKLEKRIDDEQKARHKLELAFRTHEAATIHSTPSTATG